jgi:hypothetical protein
MYAMFVSSHPFLIIKLRFWDFVFNAICKHVESFFLMNHALNKYIFVKCDIHIKLNIFYLSTLK